MHNKHALASPLLGLALMIAFAIPAEAARKVALVIGNSAYVHASRLTNPVHDARDVGALLEQLGFEVTTGIDLNADDFSQTLVTFITALKGADVALLYYAGHGMQFRNQNYLIPVDARLRNEFSVKREAFNAAEIIAQMEAEAQVNLVFLDACRDNPLADGLRANLRSFGRSASVGRGLARMPASQSETLLVYAASPGAVAEDGWGRNSPFTTAFLKHVATPDIEIEAMLKRVTSSVRKLTKGRQQPERLSRLTVEFYFQEGRTSAANTPAPVQSDQHAASSAVRSLSAEAAQAWTVIGQTQDADVLKAFVDRYGSTFYGTLARQKLAKLEQGALASTAPSSPALGPKITGHYRATGTNPDGSRYTGKVQIWKDGKQYRMKWQIAGQVYSGKGTLKDDVLTIDWGQKHPVIYKIGPNGVLSGLWANGRGTEELKPKN